MKTIITTLAAGLMAFAATAGNPQSDPKTKVIHVDTKSSSINWLGEKLTGEHSGTLMIKEGSINMTDGVPTSATIVLDMATIAVTDIEDADTNAKLVGHLKNDDFFGVKKHKTGKFEATTITAIKGAKGKEANYTLSGKLTLKGISEDLSFPAYIAMENGNLVANGSATFDRTKYGIKYSSKSFFDDLGDRVIYDDVKLTFVLSAK